MSSWNYNEEHLRQWTPRRPSPELRKRLFGEPAVTSTARLLSDFSRWLVPAFGCFLLVVGSLSQRPPTPGQIAEEMALLGKIEARPNNRFMLAEARQHSEINAIPVKHMEYSIRMRTITQPTSNELTSFTNKLIQQ